MTPVLANTPVIETERLALRAPAAADWPAWRAFLASPRSDFIRAEDYDEGKAWRAIDIHEGEEIDEEALKALIRAPVTLNASSARR